PVQTQSTRLPASRRDAQTQVSGPSVAPAAEAAPTEETRRTRLPVSHRNAQTQ
ncbi:unnamed protein product, partial [Amoebophrya sp. A120]